MIHSLLLYPKFWDSSRASKIAFKAPYFYVSDFFVVSLCGSTSLC